MKTALLLIDLQNDFLARSALDPPAEDLIRRVEHLLRGCRELNIPVLHAHTVVRADGTDRMPHWKRNEIWECVVGTPGCKPPKELGPREQEPVFQKQFFSAFRDGRLEATLNDLGVDTLIVSGLYLHGCVRSTIIDAYERGFEIWVAEDATASTDPLHARVTREYMSGRTAAFLPSERILKRLRRSIPFTPSSSVQVQPVGNIAGKWLPATHHALWEHRNPGKWKEVLGVIPLASEEDVATAAAVAISAQRQWVRVSRKATSQLLLSWAAKLSERETDLARLMALELGKPITLGHDEVRFAIELLHATASMVVRDQVWEVCGRNRSYARRCPPGVVGIITPWNNPVAIPVGKLGPAIAFGNGVVWKAALQAPRTTRLVMEMLLEAGSPSGLVNLLFGGAGTARQIIYRPEVEGISFTGSCAAGREVARLCAHFLKPLQAELGGNNAAIIMPDADVEKSARELTFAAFGFSGQRCTATRRFIVHQAIRRSFEKNLLSSIQSLHLGDPMDPETHVGPVISREKQRMLRDLVREASLRGARVLYGGKIPPKWDFGCWFEPTVMDTPDPTLTVVQEETFGPVAVLQTAQDLDNALELINGVPQGLVASLYSHDMTSQRRFLEEVKSGVLKLNQPTLGVVPEAPFGGWKASGLGPPEHGIWDQEFYTRAQALYGWSLKEEKGELAPNSSDPASEDPL